MKIAIVTEYYYPSLGGISEHVHFFSRELARLGHEPTIITSKIPGGEKIAVPPGVQVLRVGRGIPYFSNGSFARVTWGSKLRSDLEEILHADHYDIVHIHSPTVPVLPLLTQTVWDGVTVGTMHTYFESHPLYALFQKRLQRHFENLDGRIAVSTLCTDSLRQYFDVDFQIIPNGVDIELFSNGHCLPQYDDGRVNILFLARLDPRNGLDCLLQAFSRVHELHPETRLIVVGDGPLRRYYHMVADPHLRRHIEFVGEIAEGRPDYYASADVFCFPAQKASFGITMLEAMAAGIPIVASDLEAFRQIVTKDKEALLVNPFDPLKIAEAIVQLIESPEAAQQMARQAYKRVERYSWKRVTAEVVEYYNEVLRRSRLGPPAPPLISRSTNVQRVTTIL